MLCKRRIDQNRTRIDKRDGAGEHWSRVDHTCVVPKVLLSDVPQSKTPLSPGVVDHRETTVSVVDLPPQADHFIL